MAIYAGLGVKDKDIVKISKYGGEDHGRYLSSYGHYDGGKVTQDPVYNKGSWAYCHDSTDDNALDNFKVFAVDAATNIFEIRKQKGPFDLGRYLNSYGCNGEGKRESHSTWVMVDDVGRDASWEVVDIPSHELPTELEKDDFNLFKLRKHSGVDAEKFLCSKGASHNGKRTDESSWVFVTSASLIAKEDGHWLFTIVNRVADAPPGPTPTTIGESSPAPVQHSNCCQGCYLKDELWDGTPLNLQQQYDVRDRFTMSAWVKVRVNKGWGRILSKSSQDGKGWEFRVRAGIVEFVKGARTLSLSDRPYICDGTWHHVVVSFGEHNKLEAYVEGRSTSVGVKWETKGVTSDPDADLWLGGRDKDKFEGELTCIHVFNYALNVQEMAQFLKVPELVKAEREAQEEKAAKAAEARAEARANREAADDRKIAAERAAIQRKRLETKFTRHERKWNLKGFSKARTLEAAKEKATKNFETAMLEWIQGTPVPASLADSFNTEIQEKLIQCSSQGAYSLHYVTNRKDLTLLTVRFKLRHTPIRGRCLCLRKNKFWAEMMGSVHYVKAFNVESFDNVTKLQNIDDVNKNGYSIKSKYEEFESMMRMIKLVQETE